MSDRRVLKQHAIMVPDFSQAKSPHLALMEWWQSDALTEFFGLPLDASGAFERGDNVRIEFVITDTPPAAAPRKEITKP